MAFNEHYPSSLLSDAVDAIGSLPGVGRRSALRLALHLLKQPKENVHHFTEAINRLRDEVRYCRVCKMISDGEVCSICSDRSRDSRIICVVENVRDVMSIEETGQYHGVYHVLGGIISPIAGVGLREGFILRRAVFCRSDTRSKRRCGRGDDSFLYLSSDRSVRSEDHLSCEGPWLWRRP